MAHYEATPIAGSKSGLGEGTLWDERRGSFLWVDVLDGYIKEYLPKNKEVGRAEFRFGSFLPCCYFF